MVVKEISIIIQLYHHQLHTAIKFHVSAYDNRLMTALHLSQTYPLQSHSSIFLQINLKMNSAVYFPILVTKTLCNVT